MDNASHSVLFTQGHFEPFPCLYRVFIYSISFCQPFSYTVSWSHGHTEEFIGQRQCQGLRQTLLYQEARATIRTFKFDMIVLNVRRARSVSGPSSDVVVSGS